MNITIECQENEEIINGSDYYTIENCEEVLMCYPRWVEFEKSYRTENKEYITRVLKELEDKYRNTDFRIVYIVSRSILVKSE